MLHSGLVYHAAYAGGAVVMGGLLAGPFGAMLGGIFGNFLLRQHQFSIIYQNKLLNL